MEGSRSGKRKGEDAMKPAVSLSDQFTRIRMKLAETLRRDVWVEHEMNSLIDEELCRLCSQLHINDAGPRKSNIHNSHSAAYPAKCTSASASFVSEGGLHEASEQPSLFPARAAASKKKLEHKRPRYMWSTAAVEVRSERPQRVPYRTAFEHRISAKAANRNHDGYSVQTDVLLRASTSVKQQENDHGAQKQPAVPFLDKLLECLESSSEILSEIQPDVRMVGDSDRDLLTRLAGMIRTKAEGLRPRAHSMPVYPPERSMRQTPSSSEERMKCMSETQIDASEMEEPASCEHPADCEARVELLECEGPGEQYASFEMSARDSSDVEDSLSHSGDGAVNSKSDGSTLQEFACGGTTHDEKTYDSSKFRFSRKESQPGIDEGSENSVHFFFSPGDPTEIEASESDGNSEIGKTETIRSSSTPESDDSGKHTNSQERPLNDEPIEADCRSVAETDSAAGAGSAKDTQQCRESSEGDQDHDDAAAAAAEGGDDDEDGDEELGRVDHSPPDPLEHISTLSSAEEHSLTAEPGIYAPMEMRIDGSDSLLVETFFTIEQLASVDLETLSEYSESDPRAPDSAVSRIESLCLDSVGLSMGVENVDYHTASEPFAEYQASPMDHRDRNLFDIPDEYAKKDGALSEAADLDAFEICSQGCSAMNLVDAASVECQTEASNELHLQVIETQESSLQTDGPDLEQPTPPDAFVDACSQYDTLFTVAGKDEEMQTELPGPRVSENIAVMTHFGELETLEAAVQTGETGGRTGAADDGGREFAPTPCEQSGDDLMEEDCAPPCADQSAVEVVVGVPQPSPCPPPVVLLEASASLSSATCSFFRAADNVAERESSATSDSAMHGGKSIVLASFVTPNPCDRELAEGERLSATHSPRNRPLTCSSSSPGRKSPASQDEFFVYGGSNHGRKFPSPRRRSAIAESARLSPNVESARRFSPQRWHSIRGDASFARRTSSPPRSAASPTRTPDSSHSAPQLLVNRSGFSISSEEQRFQLRRLESFMDEDVGSHKVNPVNRLVLTVGREKKSASLPQRSSSASTPPLEGRKSEENEQPYFLCGSALDRSKLLVHLWLKRVQDGHFVAHISSEIHSFRRVKTLSWFSFTLDNLMVRLWERSSRSLSGLLDLGTAMGCGPSVWVMMYETLLQKIGRTLVSSVDLAWYDLLAAAAHYENSSPAACHFVQFLLSEDSSTNIAEFYEFMYKRISVGCRRDL
eukprot:ANDGO_08090.mRNA.1 hypothetical protein